MLKEYRQTEMELSPYQSLYDMIIPPEHILRKLKENIDFSFVNPMLKKQYCEHYGRPAKEPEMPFLFQDGVLIRVFIARCAVRIPDKRHKLLKQPFPPHTQLFAKALAWKVVILRLNVNAACAFFFELIIKIRLRCFIRIVIPLEMLKQSMHKKTCFVQMLG